LNNLIVHFMGIIFLYLFSITIYGQSFENYKEKHRPLVKNIFSSTSQSKNNTQKKYNKTTCTDQKLYRQIEGNCNNINNDASKDWGSTQIPLKRFIPDVYNKNSDLVGLNRSHPRAISNTIFKTDKDIPSSCLSSFVFTWGQFLDHDMILTPVDSEEINIAVLPNDIIINPIPFKRSATLSGTGTNGIARQQINVNTAWIDASQVYGSDVELANQLRTFKNGKLKTSIASNGEMILPLINDQFLAGDERALEQPGLTSLHILFIREHNRICDALIACGITTDETIYQQARKKVGALLQSITYNEFLPALGIQLPNYKGYNNTIQPDILNVFATAAFRLGHTMVTDELVFYNDEGELLERLPLAEAFFKPSITQEKGVETILNGLAQQFQQKIDAKVVESLRSFLFGAPPNAGFDLVALNIQRGRDHGLDDYNTYRTTFGIPAATNFSDITNNIILQNNLKTIYNNDVNDIDVWVGLLSEDHLPNAFVGQTLHAILSAQFTALRDGDFYYYKNDPALSEKEKINIDQTRLSDIIKRNTNIQNIKYNVFHAPCNQQNVACNCEPDNIICNCTSLEICNQGYCEPIIESEACICAVKVKMINEGTCKTDIYNLQKGIQKFVTTIEPDNTFTLTAFKNEIFKAHPFNEPLNKQYYFIKTCDKQIINVNFKNCVEKEEHCAENSTEEKEVNAIYRVNVFNQITAANVILKDAWAQYKAGEKIILKPGFKAIKGSYFNARIDQICNQFDDLEEEQNKLKNNENTLSTHQIFPNPTVDFFTLKYQLTKTTIIHIAMHNSTGKKLDIITKAKQKAGLYEVPYNIQHLSSGIYFLTLSTPDFVTTKKLIIHH